MDTFEGFKFYSIYLKSKCKERQFLKKKVRVNTNFN